MGNPPESQASGCRKAGLGYARFPLDEIAPMPPVPPHIPGHTILATLGQGSCGDVFLAKDGAGRLRAIKVLKAMGINRRWLMDAHGRLAESEGHPGIIGMPGSDFESRPPWILMDFHGSYTVAGPSSATLEPWFAEPVAPARAWPVLRQIADALAFLHRIGVGHGNLHPRNILLTDEEQGQVALTDFSQGWVDGVYQLDGTEAMLYASPEQLAVPDGRKQGVWGGWDVFAFGTLAYRMLTGRFPRADAERRELEARRARGVSISPGDVLGLFPVSAAFDWENSAKPDWEEAARREIIERCLAIDPEIRYKDMREVLGEFSRIDEERHLRDERDRVRLLRQREVATLRSTRILALAMGAGFVVATLTAMVQANRHRVAARELADLKTRYANMLAENASEARTRESSAKQRVDSARAQAAGAVQEAAIMRETLVLSQEQADQLFAIVQDRKPANHPGFKDHAKTAAELKAFYEGFVAKVGKQAGMEVECARATDNLAELARSAGDRDAAMRWQADAVKLWEALAAKQPEHNARLARALLCQAQGQFQADDLAAAARSLKRCRDMFERMEKDQPGAEPVQRQLAACYLLQGRIERQQGHAENALALYRAATAKLQALTEKTGRFDYRSELASGYVEMGELARGIDDLEKAANVQRAALGQLVSMVEEKPEMRVPKLDLARAYGELGEIECQAGNPDQGLAMLGKALEILDGLLVADPSATEILFQKAIRLSALARSYRDQGKRGESEKLAGQAHDILAKLVASPAASPASRYQFALVMWQRAEIQGDLSQVDASIATMQAAVKILQELDASRALDPTMHRQLRVSLAYLDGDLGHRLQEANRRADALKAFQAAVKHWQEIAAAYGEDATTAEALAWSQRRAAELKAP